MRNNGYKIVHWFMFIVFLVVAATAIMNTTFYSKESIMETFKFSFPMLDIYDIGSADKLFIARIERREGWVFHFFGGCLLFGLAILSLIWFLIRSKTQKLSTMAKRMIMFTFVGISVMFVSGLPLYVRAFIDIAQEHQDFARAVHYYMAYGFWAVVIIHIAGVIYKENKEGTNKISNMFKLTSLFIVSALLVGFNTQVIAKEVQKNEVSHYDIGMAFYTGERGAKVEIKNLPNCPYDFCKNAELMKKKFGVEEAEGDKTIEIKNPDMKKALFFLQKGAYEDKDERAMEMAIKIMLGEVNYKDKTVDAYLLKNLEKNLGYENIDQYSLALRNLLLLGSKSNNCYIQFKVGEFKEYGYMQIFERDKKSARPHYLKAVSTCNEGRFEKMLAKSKL